MKFLTVLLIPLVLVSGTEGVLPVRKAAETPTTQHQSATLHRPSSHYYSSAMTTLQLRKKAATVQLKTFFQRLQQKTRASLTSPRGGSAVAAETGTLILPEPSCTSFTRPDSSTTNTMTAVSLVEQRRQTCRDESTLAPFLLAAASLVPLTVVQEVSEASMLDGIELSDSQKQCLSVALEQLQLLSRWMASTENVWDLIFAPQRRASPVTLQVLSALRSTHQQSTALLLLVSSRLSKLHQWYQNATEALDSMGILSKDFVSGILVGASVLAILAVLQRILPFLAKLALLLLATGTLTTAAAFVVQRLYGIDIWARSTVAVEKLFGEDTCTYIRTLLESIVLSFLRQLDQCTVQTKTLKRRLLSNSVFINNDDVTTTTTTTTTTPVVFPSQRALLFEPATQISITGMELYLPAVLDLYGTPSPPVLEKQVDGADNNDEDAVVHVHVTLQAHFDDHATPATWETATAVVPDAKERSARVRGGFFRRH